MEITGVITGIKYKVYLAEALARIETTAFDINTAPAACLLDNGKYVMALSKWVAPKRTRSYPFERVYNTLTFPKRATVIPVVKDEGAAGDRDFIQWDTVALMSLLDVFVIFAYYVRAEKRGEKITNQQFDEKYVAAKVQEIEQYHSSALHWNLKELTENFHQVLEKVKASYAKIEKETNVKLHGFDGLEKFQNKIGNDVSQFMTFSREKAKKAQSREFGTVQPKEHLTTLTKAKMTITNYLGGRYFFTVDEVKLANALLLIESKHSATSLLPSKSNIKDGLLKMILYCNLSQTKMNGKSVRCEPILKMTSSKLKGEISSTSSDKAIENFCTENHLNHSQRSLITNLFSEAKHNHFTVFIEQAR